MKVLNSTILCFIFSLVSILGIAGTAMGVAPSGYWYLDDAQDGPYDDLLDLNNINNAECSQGCPTFNASGNVAAAQTFDGVDDGILVSPSAAADKVFDWPDDGDFSVEVWFKMTPDAANLTGNNETEVIIGRADNSEGGNANLAWWIGVRNEGGNGVRVAARIMDQEGDGGMLITNTDDDNYVDITAAGWHQVILVKRGSEVNLYVDNTLESSQEINFTTDQSGSGLASDDTPLSIGFLYTQQTTPSQNFFFKGDIDQVAIYAAALTIAEVETSYTAGMANQPIEFEPVFGATDFGMTAVGYEFKPNVNAVGNPAVTEYVLGTAPEGLQLDPDTGDINWIPTNLSIGEQAFSVSATNTLGTTTQDLTVEVVDICASVDVYWDLNETEAPFDGLVRGEAVHPDVHDAVCIGAGCPTQDTDADAVNGALAFDGTQGLSVAASAAKDLGFDWSAGESFTVAFFMKPDIANFADGGTSVMVGRFISGTNIPQWWIGLRDDAGDSVTPRLFARLEAVNGDGDATPITDTSSPTVFEDGKWYHIAMVYDHTAGSVSLYIDGVLEAAENITFDPSTDFKDDTNPMGIGHVNEGTFYRGSLDEIAIFASALDAAVLKQQATDNVGRGFCNAAPQIADTPAPATQVNFGDTYTFSPTASDEDGDGLTWSLTQKPDDMDIDQTTGAIEWVVDDGDVIDTTVSVTLMVTDGFGGADALPFEIAVVGGDTPVITGQSEVTIDQGNNYTIAMKDLTIKKNGQTVSEKDIATFTLTVLAGNNYTVDDSTVTPESDFSGDLRVNLTVNDGVIDSPAYEFLITVTKPGDTPNDKPDNKPDNPDNKTDGGGGGGGGCFISSLF